MPEPAPINAVSSVSANGEDAAVSTPLELLKAVKEVQERRISVWREYDDAFDTFLHPPSSDSAPVNGSQNSTTFTAETDPESTGRGCAGCSTTAIPLSEDLLAQILQITTQALIECGHRLRTIQTELAHSTSPTLAGLVDRIQTKENAMLRSVVQRDQLRKTSIRPSGAEAERDDGGEARARIAQLDDSIKDVREEIAELMQDVYAESLELQLADG